MKKLLIILVYLIFVFGGMFFVYKKLNLDKNIIKEPIPSIQVYKTPTQTAISPLPLEVNLAVPFTSQAPHQNWDDPYQDFCEEASILMAMSYIRGENISNPDIADAKMLAIKSFEEYRFGYHKDTNIEETAIIIKEFYKYSNISIVKNPSIEDIKKALSGGRAVIIPVAGRELGNPYFTPPGPLYHMLVIKGYTKDGNFITNDPGTRRGADFIYSPDVLLNAIHDWNSGDVENGKRVIIVVG